MKHQSCSIRNSLKKEEIQVFIQKKGEQRHGAFNGGTSRLNPGTTADVAGFSGQPGIGLIIVSELVPGTDKNKSDGLHVSFSSQFQPKSTELRMDSEKKYEFEYFFNNVNNLMNKNGDDDDDDPIDVDVKHPTEED